MRYNITLVILFGLIGCQSNESISLLAGNEEKYLLTELQADSLVISESFTDHCSTAVFTFYNSKTIQNPPKYEDSLIEPQWDYNLDLFKKIDSMMMLRSINMHSVNLRYQTDNEVIYKLTINKRDCADTLQANVRK